MRRPVSTRESRLATAAAGRLALAAVLGLAAPLPVAAADDARIEFGRPQSEPLRHAPPPVDPRQVAPPARDDPRRQLPIPDRWRIVDSLGVGEHWWDPYNPNTLKGDKPFAPLAGWGPDWFVNLGAVSDSLVESRRIPFAVGAQSTQSPGVNDVFAENRQTVLVETLVFSVSLIKGNTTYKPQDLEFKFTGAFDVNHVRAGQRRALNIDPQRGTDRTDTHFGVQEAFADLHLRNVSPRYDFDSIRVGIQPFISDFRGFVFNDQPFGVRLFGTRDDNRWQYNLAWFRRLEKDTNSGLNDLGEDLRADDLLVANAYRQDWPVLGNTTQATLIHNRNREGDEAIQLDRNGFQVRPAVIGDTRGHNYQVTYLGLSTDGHFGRWNLTSSAYLALGRQDYDPIAQQAQSIEAAFAAAELSRDFDWLRLRATALAASGDRDPFDEVANGFDAVFENPQIAGAATSFWIRQPIPLVGGGLVALSSRNGVLANLRASKEQGQSNFVNPGLLLLGVGGDADLAPEWRLIANVSQLAFADTRVLEYLRNQPAIDRDIGVDVSAGVQYRPFMSQNLVVNASIAWLMAGRGYRQLFADRRDPYSAILNLVLAY
jgi:hypothetical protein